MALPDPGTLDFGYVETGVYGAYALGSTLDLGYLEQGAFWGWEDEGGEPPSGGGSGLTRLRPGLPTTRVCPVPPAARRFPL